MLYYGGAIALLALVGLIVLVRFVARGGGRGTLLWVLLLVLAVPVAMLLLNVTQVYYRPPILWIALTAAAVIAALTFFFLAGRSLAWKGTRLLALTGVLILSTFLATVLLIFLPTGQAMVPLFEVRAQQIAEANGFEALFAPDEELTTDYLPVTELEDEEGLAIEYRRFVIQERKVEGELSEADLESIAAEGEDPFGWGRGIPSDAVYEDLEVDGRAALGVEYTDAGTLPKEQSVIRLLVFEKDGVDVRMRSEGRNEYKGERGGDEVYEYAPPLSFDEMVRIAETLEPKAD